LERRDIPPGGDVRQSYWRYVDFSSFDLSLLDMRDMDILDCDGRNAILPADGAMLDWTISRRTNWRGAVLSPNQSSFINDLAVEVILQNRSNSPPENLPGVDAAVAHLRASYAHSWQDALQAALDAGFTYRPASPVVASQARYVERMAAHFRHGRVTPVPPGEGVTRSTPVRPILARPENEGRTERLDFALSGTDRYESAQMIEIIMENRTGEPVWAHVGQLDPWPHVEIVARSLLPVPEFGWWGNTWPS
jgi:hypothetical protein